MRKRRSIRWEEDEKGWRDHLDSEPEEGGFCLRISAKVVKTDLWAPADQRPQWREEPDGDVLDGASPDGRVALFLGPDNSLCHPSSGTYDPLEQPDLFRRFTNLDFSKDKEIERFYENFGPLTWSWGDLMTPPDDEIPYGESVGLLKMEADWVRTLVEVYSAWQAKDVAGLQRLLEPILRDPRQLSDPRTVAELVLLRGHAYEYLLGLPASSEAECYEFACARALLRGEIDYRLQGVRRVVGIPQPRSHMKDKASRAARPFVPRWQFSYLIEALYLHLYDIVTGNSELRRCPVCGDLFPKPIPQYGHPKVYCSSRCRERLQKRKFRAK